MSSSMPEASLEACTIAQIKETVIELLLKGWSRVDSVIRLPGNTRKFSSAEGVNFPRFRHTELEFH